MRKIKLDKDEYELPEEWDELSEKDIRMVIRLTNKVREKNQTLSMIALSLLGLKVMTRKPVVYDKTKRKLRKANMDDDEEMLLYYIRSGITRVYLIASADLAFISTALNWMFTTPTNGSVCLSSRLSKNYISEIKIKGRKYIGPDHLFDGIKWGQFCDAEVNWAMVSEGDLGAIIRAMASLYTLEGGETDAQTKQKFKDFEKLSLEDVTLFSLYYEGAKYHLSEHYELFERGDDANFISALDTTPLSVKVHDNFIATTNLLSNLNLNEVEKTRNAFLYDALNILRQNKKNHEKWKEDLTS